MRPIPGGDRSGGDSTLGGILANPVLLAALLSCLIAQLAKPFAHFLKDKRLDWRHAVSPGGMPSSHTAFVVGMAVAVGIQIGTSSAVFAVSAVLAMVVAYDATSVRLHAGKHASVLNIIIQELPSEHPASETMYLQETLGHTPVQVAAGALVGLLVSSAFLGLWGLVAPATHAYEGTAG